MSAPATTTSRINRPVASVVLPPMPGTSPELQQALQQVVERLSVLDGQRGDSLDSAVTRRELIDSGFAALGRDGSGNNSIIPVFNNSEWTNIPYLDSMPTPTAPLFTTTIGANYLLWQLPNARGVGATEIFRRTNNDDGAIIGSVVGSQFVDYAEPGVLYYYKIRFVGETGATGDWSSEVAVLATDNPAQLVNVLTGQIGESELAQNLRERVTTGGVIDSTIKTERLARIEALAAEERARVAAIESEAVARASGLLEEATARTAGLLSEARARETAIAEEARARGTAIESEAVARASGLLEEATARTAGLLSEARARETAIAEEARARGTAIAEEARARGTAIAEEARARGTAIAEEARARGTAIESEAVARASGLLEEATARTAGLLSEARARETAIAEEARARGTAIAEEATARTNEDSSLAQRISTLASQTTATVDTLQAAITEEVTARTTADSAIAGQITSLSASVKGNTAAITAEASTRASEDVALSTMLDSLTATLDNVYATMTEQIRVNATAESATVNDLSLALARIGASESAITSEQNIRAKADSALGERITTLSAAVDTELTSTRAAISKEATIRTSADSALGERITTLSAAVDTELTSTRAAINEEATIRTSADSALGERITTLSAAVDTELTSTRAAISKEATIRTSADSALGERITTLSAAVDTELTSTRAAINEEATIRTSADSALGERITTLSAAVNNNYSTIVNNYYTRTTTDSAIAAAERRAVSSVYNLDTNGVPTTLTVSFSEKIKTEVNASGVAKATFGSKVTAGQRTAGFTYGTDGNVSEFYISADRFAVLSNSGTRQTTPFIVEGGNTYINSAIIKDASISAAKIANLDATVATIARANLYDAAVGGQIYSSNYNLANKTGWSLNQDGSAFFGSNVTFGGQLSIGKAGQANGVVINNDGLYVYDSAGKLRVAIGKLA